MRRHPATRPSPLTESRVQARALRSLGCVVTILGVLAGVGWAQEVSKKSDPDAAPARSRDPDDTRGVWARLSRLFPHAPGSRWVYTLSGNWYAEPAELSMQVRGLKFIQPLQLEAVVIDEAHPGVMPTAPKDVLPVLYYPHRGYLVRNTNHVYGDNEHTTLVKAGSIGEASAPVLPLDPVPTGGGWHTVQAGEWGEMSQLDTEYRSQLETEPVVVEAGSYTDCLRVETRIKGVSGRGFQYTEWYAPGVGLVKMITTDLRNGEIVEQKDLQEYRLAD